MSGRSGDGEVSGFLDGPRADEVTTASMLLSMEFSTAAELSPDLGFDVGEQFVDLVVVFSNTGAGGCSPARRAGCDHGEGQVVLDVCVHFGEGELDWQYAALCPCGEQGAHALGSWVVAS